MRIQNTSRRHSPLYAATMLIVAAAGILTVAAITLAVITVILFASSHALPGWIALTAALGAALAAVVTFIFAQITDLMNPIPNTITREDQEHGRDVLHHV